MRVLSTFAMATAVIALSSGAFAETYTTTSTTTSANSPYVTTTANAQSEIRLNSMQVRQLQQALRAKGYNIAVDGAYGPNTASALRSYQSSQNLSVTGQANRETLAKLNLNTDAFMNTTVASYNDVKAQSALRLSRAEVRSLQSALRSNGYNIAVDGAFGPNTASALRSYQASQNLSVTGQANRETLAKLNLDSNTYFSSNTVTSANTNAQTALRLNSTEVRGMQQALRSAGYNISVDGVYGPNTASALRSYQASQNLAVTGQANRETLAKLNLITGSTTTASTSTTTTGTSTTTSTTAALDAKTDLQLDSDEIRVLQRVLRSEGYTNIAVNGLMDQRTVNALSSYQAQNNLSVTGRANFETLAQLDMLANSSTNTNVASTTTVPSIVQLPNGDVRILQRALTNQGYNVGLIDGIVGQNTLSALRSYQAANSLSATGDLNTETLVSLNILQQLLNN